MEISHKQVCNDLLDLLKRLKIGLTTIAETHALTPPQMSALYALSSSNATMGELALNLHCDASNITGIIDRLVERRLVTRQEDPSDRRAKVLALTGKGRQVLDDIASKLPEALSCTRLSGSECGQLHALVRKLV
jgi:DNA-binding MarR family transcriptional regulator